MRVAVRHLVFAKQCADFGEFRCDLRVDGRHLFAAKKLEIVSIAAVVINRVVDLQTIAQAGQVVIVTVAGCCMDTAGARLEGNVIAEDQ